MSTQVAIDGHTNPTASAAATSRRTQAMRILPIAGLLVSVVTVAVSLPTLLGAGGARPFVGHPARARCRRRHSFRRRLPGTIPAAGMGDASAAPTTTAASAQLVRAQALTRGSIVIVPIGVCMMCGPHHLASCPGTVDASQTSWAWRGEGAREFQFPEGVSTVISWRPGREWHPAR